MRPWELEAMMQSLFAVSLEWRPDGQAGWGWAMLTPYISNPVSVSEPSTEDPGQAEHQAWEGRLLGASRGWQGVVSGDRA